ncbi:MAG: N-acetylglucosamine kinase [Cyanobium sp.]
MAVPADSLRLMPSPGEGLLAGFDAGQTHTTCRLAAAGGGTLAEAEGPGVVHLAAADGPARFMAALQQSFAAARLRLPEAWRGQPLGAAAIGASGIEAGSPVQEQGLSLAAVALKLPPPKLMVTGDERTALAGAFAGGAGIVLISGTGTIAVGSDGRGREHRCAGWGWLLDEAGSAMDIGRDALALSLRMADGRVAPTVLLERIWGALGLDPGEDGAAQAIKAQVAAPGFGAAGFASLAPLVDGLAASGDGHAALILERHAEALVAMAQALARQLELPAPAICGMGGALVHLSGLRRRVVRALARELPGSQLVPALGDACQGALQLASELAEPPEPG